MCVCFAREKQRGWTWVRFFIVMQFSCYCKSGSGDNVCPIGGWGWWRTWDVRFFTVMEFSLLLWKAWVLMMFAQFEWVQFEMSASLVTGFSMLLWQERECEWWRCCYWKDWVLLWKTECWRCLPSLRCRATWWTWSRWWSRRPARWCCSRSRASSDACSSTVTTRSQASVSCTWWRKESTCRWGGCERREQLVLPVVRLCVLVGAVRVSAAAHTVMTHLSLVFLQSETQEYLCYLYATSARRYLSSIFILPSSHCSFFKLMGCCGLVSHWLLPSSISFGLHWLFHLHKLLTVFGALPSAFFGPIFNLQVAIWVDVFDFVGKWAHCMLF